MRGHLSLRSRQDRHHQRVHLRHVDDGPHHPATEHGRGEQEVLQPGVGEKGEVTGQSSMKGARKRTLGAPRREDHSLSVARLPGGVDEKVEANLQGDEEGGAPKDGTPHLKPHLPTRLAHKRLGADECERRNATRTFSDAFGQPGDNDPDVFARRRQSSRRPARPNDGA